MADWTNIPDSSVDPDAPVTSELAYAWRDNPIAIAEGATGAPRIHGNAIMTLANMPVLNVTASNARNVGLATSVTTQNSSTESASYVECRRVEVVKLSGTVRFRLSHRREAPTGGVSSYLRVLKNGVQVNEWESTSGSATERTQDISVSPGDIIRWDHRVAESAGNDGTSYVSGGNETASNGYYYAYPIASY